MTERRSARVAAQVAARLEAEKPKAKPEPPTKRGKVKVENAEDQGKKRADSVKPKAKPTKKKAKKEEAIVRPPVDEHCPKADEYRVYVDGEGVVWHALLNQTNLRQNNNKYFKLQLLEDVQTPGHCIAWFRWGRVGYTGQMTSKGDDLSTAKQAFEQKFSDKTVNDWHAVATGEVPFSPRANK